MYKIQFKKLIRKYLARRNVIIIVVSVILCDAFLSLFLERGMMINLSILSQQQSITTTSNNNDERFIHNNNKNIKIQQYSYNNPWIIKNGCIMTVVSIIDHPKLDPTVFSTLESVAANVHPINETCIVIQTSLCRTEMEYNLIENDTSSLSSLSSYNDAYIILTELIYNLSKPLLRTLIELGNVRVTILNHTKYQILSKCQEEDDDYNKSLINNNNVAFFNIDYWSNYYYMNSNGNKVMIDNNNNNNKDLNQNETIIHGEFVTKQDSDFILIIQNDSILCHGLDIQLWNHFPFVGAPWDKDLYCNEFNQYWMKWHNNLSTGYDNNDVLISTTTTIPDYPNDMCNNLDVAPIGNGDLSLRSRDYMSKVIRYCPKVNYSGLSAVELLNVTCHHDDDDSSKEDVYFGVILRGMFFNKKNITTTTHHRMPTILEAALFSSEGRYFTDHYNDFPTSIQYSEETLVKQLWWGGDENMTRDNNNTNTNISISYHEGWERYQAMKSVWIQSNLIKPIVPIGYHAIHRFDYNAFQAAYHHIVRECPYIIDILPVNFTVPPPEPLVVEIQTSINHVNNRNSHVLIRNDVLNNLMIKQYSYRNPWIIQNGCVMTVVILDPSLGSSLYFSLESVAANVHPINETCILIQTSLCRIQMDNNLEQTLSTYDEAYIILIDTIYNSAKPLFRKLIELGNVRVSIFNHAKYQTKNCRDFRSVNAPFLNTDFWSNYYYIDLDGNKVIMNKDSNSSSATSAVTIHDTGTQVTITAMNESLVLNGEYIDQQDSDFILVIQNDAVLCHGLDVFSWNSFPYVGAAWGTGYFCNKYKKQWDGWHTRANGYNASISTIPDYPPNMCTDPEVSPYGNGGLSLRSRYWMREAIRYCPQVTYSGLSEEEIQNATCLHADLRFDSQEDVYYGMLLRGIFFNRKNITSHKMATVFDASLFATESRYYMDFYNTLTIPSGYSIEANVRERWWSGENGTRGNHNNNTNSSSFHEGWDRFQRMQKIANESNFVKPIVPIGYHAVNKYDASKIKTAYHHIVQECPYIIGILPQQFILPPLETINNDTQ